MSFLKLRTFLALVALLLLPWHRQAQAYSLLTHEQLIDLTWQVSRAEQNQASVAE
jgi:hypothetical protein